MSRVTFRTEGELHVLAGEAGTGKTQRIAESAATLLFEGVAAQEMAIFVASPNAEAQMRARLTSLLGQGAPLPLVSTLPAYALKLLRTPDVERMTGRQGRVLLRFEESILMEDMKTTGIAVKRLGEMLKFFYRSWADLEPMDEEWFYSDEESNVYAALRRQLEYRKAYLACEVPRAAWDAYTARTEAFEAFRFDHVFVDDYQMLSCASQCLASNLARKKLTVAADELASVRAFEEYPYPRGVVELQEANPACFVEKLDVGYASHVVTDAVNRLAGDEAIGSFVELLSASPKTGACEALSFERPHEELEGVARMVEDQIAKGIEPWRIGVAAANDSWVANVARALAARGVPVSGVRRLKVAGDVRDADACGLARAVTVLQLSANPADALALRSWCGFGDYLTNSGLYLALVDANSVPSLESGIDASIASSGALLQKESASVDEALGEARELLRGLADKRGRELFTAALDAVGVDEKKVPVALSAAVSAAGEEADAAQLCEAIRMASLDARFAGEGVKVALFTDFAGVRVDVMFMAGMVNGLTLARRYFDPAQVERDKRPALLASEMAKTYACAGKANEELYFTYFFEAPLDEAERMQLKIDRVRLRNKVRVCEVSPCETIRSITGVRFDD